MPAATSQRPLVLVAAGALFALATLALTLLEQPALGLSHLFYLPIALVALMTDYRLGAAAGALAGGLYSIAHVLNPDLLSQNVVTLATLIRLGAFVSTGALIGWFAHSNRELVERMRALAETDSLTALPNMRRFESELVRHCRDAAGFVLLVGDVDRLKETNDRDGHAAGNTLLRRAAAALHELAREHALTARIGGDEFAVIARATTDAEAAALAAGLEAELDRRRTKVSFGWALHPVDGRTPAELLLRADERLYRSKAARKSRETVVALLTGATVPATGT
jgi:diguanylate cyclase (GGDEF)-like protein